MAGFGGKGVGQIVAGFGESGLGKALAAIAAAFLLRLFSGPGPALSPENDAEDQDVDDQNDVGGGDTGNVVPVTIRWRNITCLLSDKSSKSVIALIFFYSFLPVWLPRKCGELKTEFSLW